MTRAFVMGIDCKVYYLGNATDDPTLPPATPTDFASDSVLAYWNELCEVQDVTLNMTAATSDVTTRCAGGWRQMVQSLKDGNPSTTLLWKPDQVAFRFLLNSYMNRWTIGMAFLDGPSAGLVGSRVTGLYAEFSIVDFSRNEPLEEAVTADFELQIAPSLSASLPEWVDLDPLP